MIHKTDERCLGKSVEQRVRSATGGDLGRESAPAGGKLPQPDWMKGEFFDSLQAKQGVIDPERGETHFMADERRHGAYSDRSHRQVWRPASDVNRGTAVKVPYATR